MKLTTIEIKNYRSITHNYDANESFTLHLSDGMNAIVGPNNVGKSNILRALRLALDPNPPFDRSLDMPSMWAWSKPVVTLTFEVPRVGKMKTLLKYVDAYERKAKTSKGPSARTYAQEGIIKLRATIEGGEETVGTRRQVFVAKGGGALSLADDDRVAVKALTQFRSCLQFVLVKSGDSLKDLLEGNFREILRTVLQEDLKEQYERAETSRNSYLSDLQHDLLAPLTARAGEELRDLFPEISGVALRPDIRSLDDALALMSVDVVDAAETDLAGKGTGVRGGLVIAMLRHLADTGRRSMLFAVEEPESFLHPAAQESLRGDLEELARRRDVSLLVTTHSPHIVSRATDSMVFAIGKNTDGETELNHAGCGSKPLASVFSGLFRSDVLLDLMDRSIDVPEAAEVIIAVEGWTDKQFIEIALKAANRPDLAERISITYPTFTTPQSDQHRPAGSHPPGGAALAVMDALIANASCPLPVVALFDADEEGKAADHMLRKIGSKTGAWRTNRTLFSYAMAFEGSSDFAFEAEDLWPEVLFKGFFGKKENDLIVSKATRPKPTGGWHYELKPAAKPDFTEYARKNAQAAHCVRWVALIERILERSVS